MNETMSAVLAALAITLLITVLVLLREVEGERYLPIWIGAVEATAIAFAQQGVNERAFASVKFAGCHDQKKFIQLLDGAAQLGEVIGR